MIKIDGFEFDFVQCVNGIYYSNKKSTLDHWGKLSLVTPWELFVRDSVKHGVKVTNISEVKRDANLRINAQLCVVIPEPAPL
ncbi:MAG: hypothetical protein Harvfovirus64_7, partial [Harvfovirus sp.]